MGTCMKLTPTDSCPTAKLCRRSWNLTPALAGRAGSIVPSRRLRSALAGWLAGSRVAAKAGERMRRENVDKSIGSDQSSAVARRAPLRTPLPSRCPPTLARRGHNGASGWTGSRVIVGQVVGHLGGQPAAQRDCAPGTLGPERAGDPDKIPNGLLRTAAASGIAVGLATASLGGIGTANGTCIGFSGINIGDGCLSTLGSFAIGLGPNTFAAAGGLFSFAIANGLGNAETELTTAASLGSFNLAYAGGPDTLAQANGNLGLAVVQGANARAQAGNGLPFDLLDLAINFGNGLDTPPPLGGATGNPSLDPQTNAVSAFRPGNISANIFGNSIPGEGPEGVSTVQAGGLATMPLAFGFANAAYNLFGDGNHVLAGAQASNFGLAISAFGDRNDVDVQGPAALAAAIGVGNQIVSRTVPGITIATPFNSTGTSTNVLAASNPNKFVPKIFATGTGNTSDSPLSGSLTKVGTQFSSSLNSLSKTLSDTINNVTKNVTKNVTSGLAGGTTNEE